MRISLDFAPDRFNFLRMVEPALFTVKDLARRWGVSIEIVRRLRREGELAGTRSREPGQGFLIAASVVAAFEERHQDTLAHR